MGPKGLTHTMPTDAVLQTNEAQSPHISLVGDPSYEECGTLVAPHAAVPAAWLHIAATPWSARINLSQNLSALHHPPHREPHTGE